MLGLLLLAFGVVVAFAWFAWCDRQDRTTLGFTGALLSCMAGAAGTMLLWVGSP